MDHEPFKEHAVKTHTHTHCPSGLTSSAFCSWLSRWEQESTWETDIDFVWSPDCLPGASQLKDTKLMLLSSG